MGSQNTVKVRSFLHIQDELVANAAITPGMLVERMSTDKVRAHATGDGMVIPKFALESALEGEGLTDAYAASDQVQVWIPTRGDIVNALLADGETAVIGSKLVSNGDGYLKVRGGASSAEVPQSIVGEAREAVDLSGSSGADPATQRILVEIY